MIQHAINYYVGRPCIVGIDYTLQDDGQGTYIKTWNIVDVSFPLPFQLEPYFSLCELDFAKMSKLNLNEINYSAKRNGIEVIDGISINIDPISCGNITGQNMLIFVGRLTGANPLSITWFCDNNIGHAYTEEEFITLSKRVSDVIFIIQQKLSANKLAIADALTLEELELIDTTYN